MTENAIQSQCIAAISTPQLIIKRPHPLGLSAQWPQWLCVRDRYEGSTAKVRGDKPRCRELSPPLGYPAGSKLFTIRSGFVELLRKFD